MYRLLHGQVIHSSEPRESSLSSKYFISVPSFKLFGNLSRYIYKVFFGLALVQGALELLLSSPPELSLLVLS